MGATKGTFEYGSDYMAALLRTLGIRFAALNPGASFRGLHDSLVHTTPDIEIITCTHEEISVAVAHGYAKATGEIMAAAIHDVVGLQHASMATFNAWCDRAPVLLLGGGGPMDVAKRRPGTDWLHTALIQGNLVRDFVKWDDQPASLESLPDSLLRAHRLALSEPCGPTYVCFDAALQEDPVPEGAALELPDPSRFAPGAAPAPDPAALERLAAAVRAARWPVVLAEHSGRSDRGFALLSRLAERWALPVLDRRGQLSLPTDNPMNLTGDEARTLERADLIISLDLLDLFGTLSRIDRTARTTTSLIDPAARVFHIGLGDYAVRSLIADFQRLHPAEERIVSDVAGALSALEAALGDPPAALDERRREVSDRHRLLRERWASEAEEARTDGRGELLATSAVAGSLGRALGERPFVIANGDLSGWTHRLLDLDTPRQHLGRAGGGGLGYGIGAGIGACLAHRGSGRIVVDIQSDGDLMFTPGGIWTLAHHRLPLLVLMYNNRSYYNSEEHQITTAKKRGRDAAKAGIGTRIDDPPIDFAKMAESMGVKGIGPVRDVKALDDALEEAVRTVEGGSPIVVDVVTAVR